jgi:hypothetical protein
LGGAGAHRLDLPRADVSLEMRHGGLMVVGFIVTVIAVERAVAVRSLPAFAAPAFSAATGIVLITNLGGARLAPALAVVAAVAYAVNVAVLLERHRLPPFIIALLGALCLVVAGVVWWSGEGIPRVAPWWVAFLVLTIAAERLEILRFGRFTPREVGTGLAVLALLLAGPAITLADEDLGVRFLGAGLAGLALWLLRRDIALRTVRTDGVARFAASGVLLAYGWLVVAGALFLAWGLHPDGLGYDALIHAFFIGFVFSAIMAHEPIIAPAVTGLPFSYSPLLYAPLLVLNAGLVLRVAADIAEAGDARRWAGMIQAIAILLFLAISAATVAAGRRHGPESGRSNLAAFRSRQ